MALIQDSTIFIVLILALNYFIIHRKIPIVGDLIMLATGLAAYLYINKDLPWGLIIAIIAILDIIIRVGEAASGKKRYPS